MSEQRFRPKVALLALAAIAALSAVGAAIALYPPVLLYALLAVAAVVAYGAVYFIVLGALRGREDKRVERLLAGGESDRARDGLGVQQVVAENEA